MERNVRNRMWNSNAGIKTLVQKNKYKINTKSETDTLDPYGVQTYSILRPEKSGSPRR